VTPEITVVIPTRNRWRVVTGRALAAALMQESVDLEVVVVDDGSLEDAPHHPALADPRTRVVRHERSCGVAVARNSGIREARGSWVAFLDDDDLWSPWKLRAQLDAVRASGASFAYSAAVWVDEALRLVHGHAPPPADGLEAQLLRWNVVWGGSSNVVARTDLVRSLGGFDESFFQLADWDLWIRLAGAASGVAVESVDVALVQHAASMLLVEQRDVFDEFHALRAKHRDACARAGVQLDRARFARWVAGGHLRAGRRFAAARTFVRGSMSPGNVVRAGAALLGSSAVRSARAARARSRVGVPHGELVAARPGWLDLYG
jgi:hypothetical protein